jgi:hypothetical protein
MNPTSIAQAIFIIASTVIAISRVILTATGAWFSHLSHSSPTCRPINHAMRSNASAILSITSGSFIEVHQLHKYIELILVVGSMDDFRNCI